MKHIILFLIYIKKEPTNVVANRRANHKVLYELCLKGGEHNIQVPTFAHQSWPLLSHSTVLLSFCLDFYSHENRLLSRHVRWTTDRMHFQTSRVFFWLIGRKCWCMAVTTVKDWARVSSQTVSHWQAHHTAASIKHVIFSFRLSSFIHFTQCFHLVVSLWQHKFATPVRYSLGVLFNCLAN